MNPKRILTRLRYVYSELLINHDIFLLAYLAEWTIRLLNQAGMEQISIKSSICKEQLRVVPQLTTGEVCTKAHVASFCGGVNWLIKRLNGRIAMAFIRGLYTAIIRIYGHYTAIIRPLYEYTAIIRPSYCHHTAIIRLLYGYYTAIIRIYGHYTAFILPSYGFYTDIIRPLYEYTAIIRPLYNIQSLYGYYTDLKLTSVF